MMSALLLVKSDNYKPDCSESNMNIILSEVKILFCLQQMYLLRLKLKSNLSYNLIYLLKTSLINNKLEIGTYNYENKYNMFLFA